MNITQERVEEIREEAERIIAQVSGLMFESANELEVVFASTYGGRYRVQHDVVYDRYTGMERKRTYCELVADRHIYCDTIKKLQALLQESDPTTVSEIRCRVAELEARLDEEVAQFSRVFKDNERLSKRNKELEEQLQGSVSQPDHEQKMAEWRTSYDQITKQRDKARKESAQNMKWFHIEYAKNAEAGR